MRAVSRTITVRFQVPGMHRWPEATGPRAYLAAGHRHLFHFAVTVPVGHDERDIEFHDLLAHVQATFDGLGLVDGSRDFGRRSCESLAAMVAERVYERWPVPVTVAVFEDNENGATVAFEGE